MNMSLSLRPDYGHSTAALPRGDMIERVASAYLREFSPLDSARRANMEKSPLNGLRKQKVLDILNSLMDPFTKGMHRDQYWRPIQGIRAVFEHNNIPADPLDGSGTYEHDKDTGNTVAKTWRYKVPFTNQNGREDAVYVLIRASGAGPVSDPLSVYDVVAYAS